MEIVAFWFEFHWSSSLGFQLSITLRWRHNDHDGVYNHQHHGCLLNRLFRRRSKKTSKPCITGLYVGNSPGPVNSTHKGPVTREMFPFDDVIMKSASSRAMVGTGEVKTIFCEPMLSLISDAITGPHWVNPSSPGQNDHRFTNDIFRRIFVNEKNVHFD